MQLDPQAQAVLARMKAASEREIEPSDFAGTLAKARRDAAGLAAFSGPAPAGCERRDLTVPGTARTAPVPVRLYVPAGGASKLLVWFHGGGTIAGSLDTHEPVLVALAVRTGRAVASVGYSLAPEAVFPVQHDQCLEAARWLARESGAHGLDPAGWALGGDSIGGLYATATAIALRDEGFGPAPAAQVLVYPNTDLRPERRFLSLQENEGRVMTRDSLRFEATTAVPRAADRASPRASPLLVDDLGGLAPAFIATAAADPLRDEGEAYAGRLAAAGVAVEHRRFPGMIHAFLQMNAAIDAADVLMSEIAFFLRRF